MAERYVGRHRRAELALAAATAGSAPKGLAFRPLLHAGASVALATAAVGGYLTAGGAADTNGVTLADPAFASANVAASLSRTLADAPVALTAFDATAADAEIAQLAAQHLLQRSRLRRDHLHSQPAFRK